MLWLILSVIIIATSPIGRAIADRIAGRTSHPPQGGDLDDLERRIHDRLMELEDRLELTERMLKQIERGKTQDD